MTQTDPIAIANARQTKPRRIEKGEYLYRGFTIQKQQGGWYAGYDTETCPTDAEMREHWQRGITSYVGFDTLKAVVAEIDLGYRLTAQQEGRPA